MDVTVGCRVAYALGKSGVVRYIGPTDVAQGEWVGIELDKPEGKNNGELNGRVYFTCEPNHGLFVKKTMIKSVLSRPGETMTTTRASTAQASSTAPGSTSSRLQQLRDRRATTIGTTGAPSVASTPRSASSVSSSTSSAGRGMSTPPTSSSGGAASSAASVTRRTSVNTSRLSVEPNARRPSLARTPSKIESIQADDQLSDAKARIAKLEEELEQKNRHVEQLKQSLSVMRESKPVVAEASESVTDAAADETQEEQEEAMDVDASADEDVAMEEESNLVDQIEIVKREAEEHVRAVRAELEDYIAQLQSENEQLVDELRLENATQTSDIKSLEAEIVQRNARIAQFTADEQKKAEDVALAVAKTSTGARKVEALESQVAEFQDMIEMMTLDKETLEMDKEIAEERVEELLGEMEKLKAALALASAAPEPKALEEFGSSADLAEENKKLRAAIKALHDRAAEEKADLSKKLRQYQRENAELVNLREEVEQLTQRRTKLEAEVEELKELLDVANAYESMVEDLTEKNLSLGEKVADLEATVLSLESLKEMAEEMEHQHTEYEAELRDEVESQRAVAQELKEKLAEQKTIIEDRDRTIARFRDLTHQHREDINQLRAQLRAETGELESLKGTAHVALNQTMSLRTLAAAAREHEAEAAKQKINAEQARLENSFLRAVVPTSIFTETDQQVLRVRLRLGRVAGKADILLQYLRKDLDMLAQQDAKDEGSTGSAVDSARSLQQILLGEKLAAVSCQAKEDLFMLECHLTTEEEFAQSCAKLDTTQIGSVEGALDAGLSSFAEGTLQVSRSGEASVHDRLMHALEEWYGDRLTTRSVSEGFPVRCAVVKLRARKSVQTLVLSLALMITFLRSTKTALSSPESDVHADVRSSLAPHLDAVLEALVTVLNLSHHFFRRAELDLAPADEDLDGLVAAGGDVIEMTHSYATEAHSLWQSLEEKMSSTRLQQGANATELVAFAQTSLVIVLSSLKERISSLYKVVCRGSFTDAVAPRTRDRMEPSSSFANGRPQWQIRAQAIHTELLHASTLRVRLNEANELCQALHTRIRELERSDSQYRVVTQKLESEVLRLTEAFAQATNEKNQMTEQLAKEREQFDTALDESHKEKTALDTLNRELRKQLKRSTDLNNAAQSHASSRSKGSLSQADMDAFRKAFAHLHSELHQIRATLAKERLDRLMGSATQKTSVSGPMTATQLSLSDPLTTSLKDVSKFARQVRAELSMPRLVDLRLTTPSAQDQLVNKQLAASKNKQALEELRLRISRVAKQDGWGPEVVGAMERGETVFGWHPPEMERPPLFLGRVTLGSTSTDKMQDVASSRQLVLNRTELQKLTQVLSC